MTGLGKEERSQRGAVRVPAGRLGGLKEAGKAWTEGIMERQW